MLCSTEVGKRPPAGKWPESNGQRGAVSRRWGKWRSQEQFESCFLVVGILEIERNVVTRESHGEEWTQDLESAKPKALAWGPAPPCQLDGSGKVTRLTEAPFSHLHWDHIYFTASAKITSVCKKGYTNIKLLSFCKKKKAHSKKNPSGSFDPGSHLALIRSVGDLLDDIASQQQG